jgi:hypothetical protein
MLTPDVTPADIGRRVIYRESVDHPGRKVETGVISSFTPQYVFVRYRGVTSAATRREDLEWADADKSNAARPDAFP